MKKILPFLLFFICIHAYPQSIKKANKYLDAGEFQNAETEFNLVREKDSLNPELWLGYAMLYSNEKFSPHNFFKAYEFAQKSSDLYYSLDSKGKNKLSKSYSIDSVSQYKLIIDQKLFNYLKLTDDITLYEKYLTDCKKCVYVKQITELRNANAFKTTAKLNSLEAYKDFIANYPGASQTSIAVTKRDQLAFKQTVEKNTIQAYDEYLTEYKYSTYVNTAVGLKNELLFLSLLDSPSKDSINALIGLMQQQNPKPQHLIDCSNKLLKILDAQNDWIIYLSDSNLYKMNQVDYKITQLTNSGDILSFAISPKGDMAYLEQKDEKTVEIYKFNIDGVSSKICEYKAKNNFSFENNFNTFEISDDIDYIRLGYGSDIEIEANQCLWSAKTMKWEECTSFEIYSNKCKTDFSIVGFNFIKFNHVNSTSTGDLTVKKVNRRFELFYRTTNGEQRITETSGYTRDSHYTNGDNFSCYVNGNKLFFYFVSTCGDFCYGPYFIVNLDGTNQRFLHHSGMNLTYHTWDYNGDLIVLSTEFENSDNINALCLFYGYENNKKVLAKNVDMFRSIKCNSSDNMLYSNDILKQLIEFKSTFFDEYLNMIITLKKDSLNDCHSYSVLFSEIVNFYDNLKNNSDYNISDKLFFEKLMEKLDRQTNYFSSNPCYALDSTLYQYYLCIDSEKNLYKTIKIGEQVWFAENLKYLPFINNNIDLTSNDSPYYCTYSAETDISKAKKTNIFMTYGALYNWPAAKTACPNGWHLPSDEEWQILEKHFGMEVSVINSFGLRGSNEGSKLAGISDNKYGIIIPDGAFMNVGNWQVGNLIKDTCFNLSGFNVLPAGSPEIGGPFWSQSLYAGFWTSTEDPDGAIRRGIYSHSTQIERVGWPKSSYLSVRCVKDK